MDVAWLPVLVVPLQHLSEISPEPQCHSEGIYSQLCETHCPSIQNNDTGVHVVKDQLENKYIWHIAS